jgi:hypothetical protein
MESRRSEVAPGAADLQRGFGLVRATALNGVIAGRSR